MLRDIFLGNYPSVFFTKHVYAVTAFLSSAVFLSFAMIFKAKYAAARLRVDAMNNIIDAVGLGALTVSGVKLAVGCGYGSNPLLAISAGVITGVGGGVSRDILCGESPLLFQKRIYALASLFGGMLFYFFNSTGVNQYVTMVGGMAAVTSVRILSTVFRWDLPKAAFGGNDS